MRTGALLVLVSTILFGGACGRDKSPASPTPSPTLTLSGTYAGDITVQNTPARMVWVVTQSGNGVSGSVRVSLPSGLVIMNGTVAGTVSGTSLMYTILVAPGGIPLQPSCSGQLSGTATGTTSAPFTLSGSYNLVTSTCNSPLTSGTFVLTKT
jgi:hypothetical protein